MPFKIILAPEAVEDLRALKANVRVFYDVSGPTVEILVIVPESEAEGWLAQFADPA